MRNIDTIKKAFMALANSLGLSGLKESSFGFNSKKLQYSVVKQKTGRFIALFAFVGLAGMASALYLRLRAMLITVLGH